MVRDKLFKGDFSYNMKLLQVTVLFYILNKCNRSNGAKDANVMDSKVRHKCLYANELHESL